MKTSNTLAAILNIFMPPFGQLVQGRLFSFILFFFVIYGCYVVGSILVLTIIAPLILFPIGLIMHIWAILDAVYYKPKSTELIGKEFWEI
jgi:hypothetical protein